MLPDLYEDMMKDKSLIKKKKRVYIISYIILFIILTAGILLIYIYKDELQIKYYFISVLSYLCIGNSIASMIYLYRFK